MQLQPRPRVAATLCRSLSKQRCAEARMLSCSMTNMIFDDDDEDGDGDGEGLVCFMIRRGQAQGQVRLLDAPVPPLPSPLPCRSSIDAPHCSRAAFLLYCPLALLLFCLLAAPHMLVSMAFLFSSNTNRFANSLNPMRARKCALNPRRVKKVHPQRRDDQDRDFAQTMLCSTLPGWSGQV